MFIFLIKLQLPTFLYWSENAAGAAQEQSLGIELKLSNFPFILSSMM